MISETPRFNHDRKCPGTVRSGLPLISRASLTRLSITIAIVMSVISAGAVAATVDPTDGSGCRETSVSNSLVMMDWTDDLKKLLDDAKDESEKGQSLVGDPTEPLTDGERALLSTVLADLVLTIDEALAAPPPGEVGLQGFGVIDTSVDPQTLEEYADRCVTMANQAFDEYVSSATYDRDYVATKLRTIRHLILRTDPHNYRTLAGISQ